MTTLGPYAVHPFADEFPLIEGGEFGALVVDIRRQGLRRPIVLTYDGNTLVDGRNRYRACLAANLDPVFEHLPERYTDQMIADYIISTNVERRHLNPGQRAVIALAYERRYAPQAKERQREAGQARSKFPEPAKRTELPADLPEAGSSEPPARRERESRERAAAAVGASGRSVQQAKKVERAAPDLIPAVRSGAMSLDAAAKQATRRLRAEPKPEPTTPAPTGRSGPVMLTLRTHAGREVPYPQPKAKATFNRTTGEGISWAGWSWNPVTGCLHGCDYCYARELAVKPSYAAAYPVGFTPLFHHERLDAPVNTTVPSPADIARDSSLQRVFVCSMADLFGRWVPDEWIDQVLTACARELRWQYLMLTKFPSRYVGLQLPATAWIGTSVDEQKRVRIAEDAFRQIEGVAVRWLSLEPLREPLEFTDLSMFDWVVIGAQTETRQPNGVVPAFAPPFEWVARIVAQAREAGCKVHLKPNLLGQVGPQSPGMTLPDEYPAPALPAEQLILGW